MIKQLFASPDVKASALLALLVLLFLWPGMLGGKALFPADVLYSYLPWSAFRETLGVDIPHNELTSDQALQNYGWKELLRESLGRGELPLWNPYIFAGMPFLAAGQAAVLYPLGLIFLLLPTVHAYLWFFALHLFLAGLGAYCYLRVIGTGRWGALFAAVTFMFSASLIVSSQWPQTVGAMVWLPWLLACLEQLSRELEKPPVDDTEGFPGRRLGVLLWAGVGAAVLALQLLAGQPEISLYTWIGLSLYALARVMPLIVKRQTRSAGAAMIVVVGLSMALGVTLAAAQLVPFAEVVQENVRAGGSSLQEVTQWALPPRQLLALIVPDLFGNPTHHSYLDVMRWAVTSFEGAADPSGQPRSYPFWGTKNYVEAASYIGVLPLVLAGIALLLRRDRYTAFFGGFGLLSLLFALGTPVYGVLFLVPGAEQLHTPFRWLFITSFCLIVLAGRGADTLLSVQSGAAPSLQHALTRWLGPGLVVAGAGVLLALTASRMLLPPTLLAVRSVYEQAVSIRTAFPSAESLYSYQFRNFALLGLFLLLSGGALWLAVRRRGLLAPALLIAVTCLDLVIFGWGYLPFTDAKLLSFQPPSLQWLQQQGGEPFRIATYGQERLLPPNSARYAGLQDIRGYDTIIPRDYVAYWRLLEEPRTLSYSQIVGLTQEDALRSPLLDLLNVKYLVTAGPISVPGFSLAYEGEVLVYRNDEALPRAFLVSQGAVASNGAEARRMLLQPGFDPRQTVVLEGEDLAITQSFVPRPMGSADLLEYGNAHITIKVATPQPGFLVLTDAYFSGWQAKDQAGNDLPVLKANSLFRAVSLPAGEHTITFSYAPASVRLGFFLSLLGAAAWLFIAGYWTWQQFHLERASVTTIQRVVKNSVTPLAAQVLARVVDLGFAVVMLRLLGPTSYGAYAFAVVFIGYFAIVTDYGLGTLLTREVSRDPNQIGRYLGNTILMRLGLCLAAAPLLAAVAWLYHDRFGLPLEAVLTTGLFFLALVPSGIAGALSALFSAHEKMEYPAVLTVLITMLRTAVGITALLLGWGIVGLGAASLVASCVNAIAFWAFAARVFTLPRLTFNLSFSRGLLSTAAPLMVNNLLNTIFFRVDVLLLQSFLGTQVVGYYHTAYKFVDGLLLIPAFLTLALFPIFSRLAETAPELLLEVYSRSVKGLLILALPIAMGVTLLAHPLILLLFGEAYEPAVRPLQLLIWFLPLSYVNGITQYVLIALNQQRYLTGAFLLATGFNIAANLIAIPRFGMEGAAVTTVLSEVVLLAPFLYGVGKHLGGLPFQGASLRPVAALVLAAAALAVLQNLPTGQAGLPPWLLATLGAGFYGALLFLLRVFDGEDRALLRRLIAR